MFDPVGLVAISLGSVVLDRPDQTGRFFAKDLAGGWAYLIGDADGDDRCRGHGVCEGGLDLTLRCAFLSAMGRVPRCGRITVLVGTREAHRMMVRLAQHDPRLAAAIAGKPISVMTRPDERTSRQVQLAAERAASGALRAREHAELHAAAVIAAPEVQPAAAEPAGATLDWRARLGGRAPVAGAGGRDTAPPAPGLQAVRGLLDPLLKGARNSLAAAGMMAPRTPRRNGTINMWLRELDSHVAEIAGDLRDAGT